MFHSKFTSFEETFGENRGNDAQFFLDDDEDVTPKKQEQNATWTAEDLMNELELLSNEAFDKDLVEKNLNRVIDWFKNTNQSKMEQAFLSELPDRLGALFGNMKDQVNELDYNATGKLQIALKNMAEVDLVKDHLENPNRVHRLKGELDAHFQELKGKLKEQGKKIKKEENSEKNIKKKKKLIVASRQTRMREIQKTKAQFKEDGDDDDKNETFSFTKSEENAKKGENILRFSN